ncbi:MAG TPA: hypothetical protein DCM64_02545 [Gammaproteobacteria bacterium]|jgi:hypothetical protein|nr:hypothetical protein [Gammaproteobacteria bacterium]HAJ75312.1 hypothetical protein [Gammaproteobacteria bacterium]
MNINAKKCSILISLATIVGLLSGKLTAQDSRCELSRTIDGHPDLQGVWANNTITPVERPDEFADKEFLTAQDIEFLQRRVGEIATEDGDALFGDGVLSAAVSGETESYDPSTGNYDQAWLANRSVHNRTSQITDPPNGKYPPRTEQAIAAINAGVERRRDHPADSWLDRSLGERCLNFGAPYLGSGYNSYWQIVQAREYVVIVQEMAHDARIIPLTDKPHLSDDIELWHGDSRGYWDGDTLIIETSNYSDKSGYGSNASDKINVGRLTRVSANELQYEIISHDPGMFTAPYTRQIIFDYSPDPIFEYACHEGNYGMTNILSGHRAQERMARESGNTN